MNALVTTGGLIEAGLYSVIPWDGKPITRPGIYSGIPIKTYHTQWICDGPSISSGGIRTIEAKSLSHFFDGSDLNPDKAEEDDKPCFSYGRALHHLAGGERGFREQFAVRPLEFDSWRTKAAKAWRAEQELAGRDVLTPDDIFALKIAAEKLAAHPTIQAGILHGLVEHSIFWRRRVTLPDGRQVVIWCKSRPDVLPLTAPMIVDLKSTSDASPQACRRSIGEFGYHIQLAMGAEGLYAIARMIVEKAVLVFIESERPCEINIKPLTDRAMKWGDLQFQRGLRTFAQAVADGVWKGYDDDEVPADLPDFMERRLSYEYEKGLLPEVEPVFDFPALPAPAAADEDEPI